MYDSRRDTVDDLVDVAVVTVADMEIIAQAENRLPGGRGGQHNRLHTAVVAIADRDHTAIDHRHEGASGSISGPRGIVDAARDIFRQQRTPAPPG